MSISKLNWFDRINLQSSIAAKKIRRSVYVVSKSGLQVVEKDGKVTNVYANPDWISRDNK